MFVCMFVGTWAVCWVSGRGGEIIVILLCHYFPVFHKYPVGGNGCVDSQ